MDQDIPAEEQRNGCPHSNYRMSFGKHRGIRLAEIPEQYLRWIAAQTDMRPHLRRMIEEHLAQDVPDDDTEPDPDIGCRGISVSYLGMETIHVGAIRR